MDNIIYHEGFSSPQKDAEHDASVTMETGNASHKIRAAARIFHGTAYETAGLLMLFFMDPIQAAECAREIRAMGVAETVELCGQQLTVSPKAVTKTAGCAQGKRDFRLVLEWRN